MLNALACCRSRLKTASSGSTQLPENTLPRTKCQIPVTFCDLGNEPVIIQRVTSSKPRETDSTTHVACLQAINVFFSGQGGSRPIACPNSTRDVAASEWS